MIVAHTIVREIKCCWHDPKIFERITHHLCDPEFQKLPIWALPMWFSKYWDFAKIGISRIFMDFRVLFWGFQVPAGT